MLTSEDRGFVAGKVGSHDLDRDARIEQVYPGSGLFTKLVPKLLQNRLCLVVRTVVMSQIVQ